MVDVEFHGVRIILRDDSKLVAGRVDVPHDLVHIAPSVADVDSFGLVAASSIADSNELVITSSGDLEKTVKYL